MGTGLFPFVSSLRHCQINGFVQVVLESDNDNGNNQERKRKQDFDEGRTAWLVTARISYGRQPVTPPGPDARDSKCTSKASSITVCSQMMMILAKRQTSTDGLPYVLTVRSTCLSTGSK
jgi:hypothetical protein